MEKELFLESNKSYRPIHDLGWGIECFNRDYKRNVVIKMENSLDDLIELISRGWQTIPGNNKWLVRSPEISLYDLSEVHRNPTLDPIKILAYYRYLKDHDPEALIVKALRESGFSGFEYLILDSNDYFESCIRIAGSDKRVKRLPRILYDAVKKQNDWNKYRKAAGSILKRREFQIHSKGFDDCSRDTQDFLNTIIKKYAMIGRLIDPPRSRVYTGFWKELKGYDGYVFVPRGGFPFMCGFAEELKSTDKIHFWEYHTTLHDNKEIVWNNNDKKARRLAVIDIAYSGKTIDYIKKQLKDSKYYNGISDIDNIGLFPKSHLSFRHLQYAVMLDTVIPVKKLKPGAKNFFEDTYINIVNGNI